MVIETKALTKNYGNINALSSLDLKVPQNSIFGFLGLNGAGKTTTMKLLLGLAKPSSGTGNIFGLDMVKQSIQIRQRIGYLPQYPKFPKQKTIQEILKFSLSFFFQGSASQANKRVDEMLGIVDLKEKAQRYIGNLSGGELQRLGLAQAQINDPDLLILDEPAASLDPIGRNDVLEVMKRLSKKSTIFYSTHILDDVQKVSDTVAILNHGKLMAQGPIETVMSTGANSIYEVSISNASPDLNKDISSLKWVMNINKVPGEKHDKWLISVSDEKEAEDILLRLLLKDPKVKILEYYKKTYELEDTFLKLVREGNSQ